MRPLISGLFVLLLLGLAFSQIAVPGGNVTNTDFNVSSPADSWDGIYGEVIQGSGLNYSYTVFGGNISQVNMVAQTPPCSTSNISMHLIAVNSTSLSIPLSPGNLTILDNFIGTGQNGSASFTSTGSFNLTYGQFINVPVLFTFASNVSSPFFREGYMNDALGNLVFIADVVDNRPDWNGSTSDYQMILPKNDTPTQYTLWVDVNYTCSPPAPPGGGDGGGGDDDHELYIDPLGIIDVGAGQVINPDFLVTDTGDFPEDDIAITLTCPSSFVCGSGSIPHLGIGHQQDISLPITVDGPGEYVITVCARSAHAHYCRDFIIRVSAECDADGDCGVDEFCQAQSCEPKKKPGEKCDRPGMCANGACSGGICVFCTSDSDCGGAQMCSGGSCIPVPCACGITINHVCERYACCADTDCGKCEICADNSCQDKESDILVISGELLEGEYIRVQVVDSHGQGIAGAKVFTEEVSAYTDSNGFASLKIPYDGIIYASADCYPQTGIMLDITQKAHFIIPKPIFENEPVGIQLVDSKGRPIAGAVVSIEGDSVVTDQDGRFTYTFHKPGPIKTRGNKAGYKIDEGDLDVLSRAIACSYPIVANLFTFTSSNIHILWAIAIIMALLNLFMFDRRFKPLQLIRKLVYSFGPLVFAVPGIGIFSICFVANIILLQFIVEVAVLLRKIIGKGDAKPYEVEAEESLFISLMDLLVKRGSKYDGGGKGKSEKLR